MSSNDNPTACARIATVVKAGVGTRPVSILRMVSADSSHRAATATIDSEPRASRNNSPNRRPVARCSGLSGMRTMGSIIGQERVIVMPG